MGWCSVEIVTHKYASASSKLFIVVGELNSTMKYDAIAGILRIMMIINFKVPTWRIAAQTINRSK